MESRASQRRTAGARLTPGVLLAWLILTLFGCEAGGDRQPHGEEPSAAVESSASEAPRYPERVVRARRLPGVASAFDDVHGQEARIGCATCHGAVSAEDAAAGMLAERIKAAKERGSPPTERVHQAIVLEHKGLHCRSCHLQEQPQQLHTVDGKRLALTDALALCSQCHGPQRRDFDHGAHGGMSGYWDLTRGPRLRNSCVNCHAPHRPAYPPVIPAAGSRDRFSLFHPAAGQLQARYTKGHESR